MATLTVTEFTGGSYLVGTCSMIPTEPSLKTSAIATSASASTATLGAGTHYVELVTDIGAWVLFSTSVVATSTNAQRFLANVPYSRIVSPSMRITVIST